MAFFKTRGIEIAGVACAIPDNCVPVESFAERFGDEAVKNFIDATGIRSIYNALPEQTAGDLAFAAAEELLKKTAIEREKIGIMFFDFPLLYIVFRTMQAIYEKI